jgi:Helix-turn-helix of DDE superfamily endonuclease
VIPEIRDDRQMRALTGVPAEKFSILEAAFALALDDEKERAYQEGISTGQRQRKPGGGQKGKLPTVNDKLVFLLYYLKVYPTFDVLGAQFGMSRSKACENVHALRPILYKALQNLGVMPYREFKTVAEFRAACAWIDDLLIDATERPHSRPANDAKQKDLYSGKKTTHD